MEAMLTRVLGNTTEMFTSALQGVVSSRQGGSQGDSQKVNSTIKIEPKLAWPELGNDTGNPQEAENFIKAFEAICNLANNGHGMKPLERVMTIGNCLKKGRKLIYDNIIVDATADGTLQSDPWSVYEKIKARLLLFAETAGEKQIRVRNEWQELRRHQGEALLEYEARWEEKMRYMKQAGLTRTEDEYFIDYINKIGEEYSKIIRFDKRYYQYGGHRQARTWQEAHVIAFEIEKHMRDSKAIRREIGGTHGGVTMCGAVQEAESVPEGGAAELPGVAPGSRSVVSASPCHRRRPTMRTSS